MVPSSSSISPPKAESAILFADVHGYAQLMSRDEQRTFDRVTQAITLIRSLIGDYSGRVVQTSGDGVLALFDTPQQALKFAVEIQREFRNDVVWNADEDPIAFRVGINFGEVLGGDSNVQGHSVNIAARLQALAQPGGICISEAVQRRADDLVGIKVQSLGVQRLKNIDETVEVYSIEVNGQTALSPLQLPSLDQPKLPPTEASVAVLPLENLSGDRRDVHLCDGITGDIINNLSRFRDLLVIARRSAFLFKNQELNKETIGQLLGVRYLLNGALQRDRSKIRLSVELAEAATGAVIWSDRYMGDLGDIFAFQDDVTDLIAARLAIQISAAERRRNQGTGSPPDLRAYGLNLRGQDLSLQFSMESNTHARRLFEQAAALAPDYGRSYAGISQTFNMALRYQWTDATDQCLEMALRSARKAIEYDSLDARGHAELGFAYLYGRQHDASLAAYEHAAELNPNDADILAEMGSSLSSSGQAGRAIELLQRAIRLNPYHPDWYLWDLGEAYFDEGNYEEVIKTLSRMRDKSEGHRLLAASYALLGDLQNARHHADRILELNPDFSIAHWRTVPPDRDPEPVERLIEGLKRSGLK